MKYYISLYTFCCNGTPRVYRRAQGSTNRPTLAPRRRQRPRHELGQTIEQCQLEIWRQELAQFCWFCEDCRERLVKFLRISIGDLPPVWVCCGGWLVQYFWNFLTSFMEEKDVNIIAAEQIISIIPLKFSKT